MWVRGFRVCLMSSGMHRMTASEVRLKAAGLWADGGGLYLRVGKTQTDFLLKNQ